jgi:hypothetical protein
MVCVCLMLEIGHGRVEMGLLEVWGNGQGHGGFQVIGVGDRLWLHGRLFYLILSSVGCGCGVWGVSEVK